MRAADLGILPDTHLIWIEYIMTRIALGAMTRFAKQSTQALGFEYFERTRRFPRCLVCLRLCPS